MTDPFSARFPGTCAACGERYPTATSIRRADDTYIHADCDEQPDPDPLRGQHAPSAGSDTRQESATDE